MKRDFTILWDLKACVLHSLYSATDPSPIPVTEGYIKSVPHAEKGLEAFLSRYFDKALDLTNGSVHEILAVADGGHEYRTKLFPGYKDRIKRPDIVREQEKKAHDLVVNFLKSMGVTIVYLGGEEADDVIAYLTRDLPGKKLVYTNDYDLVQLSSEDTSVFVSEDLKTHITVGNLEVPPELVPMAKSIVGDKSDTYPGVPRLGPKALESLVDSFGWDGLQQLADIADKEDVKGLQSAVSQNPDKVLYKIADNWETWFLSYTLAKSAPDLCTGAKKRLTWVQNIPSLSNLKGIMEAAELRYKTGQYAQLTANETLVTQDNLEEFMGRWQDYLEQTPYFAWDYETSDKVQVPEYRQVDPNYVDMRHSEITGVSIALGKNCTDTHYFSFNHKDTANLPFELWEKLLSDMEDTGKPMPAHNKTFEGTVTNCQMGGRVLRCWEDTAAYAHHVDENDLVRLKHLAVKYFNYPMMTYTTLMEALGVEKMCDTSAEDVMSYGCDDSTVTAALYRRLRWITDLEGSTDFIETKECPAVATLSKAQTTGMRVDLEELKRLSDADDGVIETCTAALRKLLKASCSEPNFEYVYAFYDHEKPFIEKSKGDGAKEALNTFLTRLKKGSVYQDWVSHEVVPEFSPTPVQLSRISEDLGLGPVEKVSNDALVMYLTEKNQQPGMPENAKKFLSLLARALTYGSLSALKADQDPTPVEFKPTPKNLQHVASYLGLPLPEKASTKYLLKYCESRPEGMKSFAQSFISLLEKVVVDGSIKTKQGETYEDFSQFCQHRLDESQNRDRAEGRAAYLAFYEFCQAYNEKWSKTIWEGTELNLNSPPQKQALIYVMLGLPVRVHSDVQPGSTRDKLGFKGAPATNEAAISLALAEDCGGDNEWKKEILETLMKVTKATTRKSFYWDPYPIWAAGGGGFVYPGFIPCEAATRRVLSRRPNSMQISKGNVRNIFVPRDPDRVILSSDFSSQELVTLADRCKDPTMLEVYQTTPRGDLHAKTGCRLGPELLWMQDQVDASDLEWEGKQISYDWFCEHKNDENAVGGFLSKIRKDSKTGNFGTIYEVSAESLAIQLRIPVKVAQTIIDSVLKQYPGIQRWRKEVHKFGEKNGYVATTYGSRRHCYGKINARNSRVANRTKRQIANYLIQGQCGDLLKDVLADIHNQRLFEKFDAFFLSPVYDELLTEPKIATLYDFIHRLSDIMEKTMPDFVLPMVAEHSIGWSWGQQIELGARPSKELIDETLEKLYERKNNAN